jgi:hypothetical protein
MHIGSITSKSTTASYLVVANVEEDPAGIHTNPNTGP